MVSIVVVAHNEEAKVQGRLINLLNLNYPQERFDIVFASDGSTDFTLEEARTFEHAGVRIAAFETRRGKPAVLNDLVPKAQGDIVVLADARQHFDRDVLRALVRSFGDPQVGAVSGELILTPNAEEMAIGKGVGLYWRYEKFIRRYESCIDSTVGATGAIYAIRRQLFEPIPEDTLLDDVLIPMRIARQGYRVLFEPQALAFDQTATTATEEFTRKVRTIAGNFQILAREQWLLDPHQNRLWLQTISHKGLRLLGPLFLLGALVANLLIVRRPFFAWTLGAQIVFYMAALGGYALRNARSRLPLLSVPYVFCLLNGATVLAFSRFVSRRQRVTWERHEHENVSNHR